MRLPSSTGIVFLTIFLVTVINAQRGQRRFNPSSAPDNLPVEDVEQSRNHRFRSRDSVKSHDEGKKDLAGRDAEILPPSSRRGSSRVSTGPSLRSRNTVSGREISRKEIPIVSSGAAEYERLQNAAEPTRRSFAPRTLSTSGPGHSDETFHSSKSQIDEVEPSEREATTQFSRRPFSGRNNNNPNLLKTRSGTTGSQYVRREETSESTTIKETTTPPASYRTGNRVPSRSSSQPERSSARDAVPSNKIRGRPASTASVETQAEPGQNSKARDTSRRAGRQFDLRSRPEGRSNSPETGDTPTVSRPDATARGSFRSRRPTQDKTDESPSTSGRSSQRGESVSTAPGRSAFGDASTQVKLNNRLRNRYAKIERKPLNSATEQNLSIEESTSPAVELSSVTANDVEPQAGISDSVLTPKPVTRSDESASRPPFRSSQRGTNKGRGSARASAADLKSGGLKEKETEEVSDNDNYPEVYKQLKKSGTDPKQILVPKYKQIISKYVVPSEKIESSRSTVDSNGSQNFDRNSSPRDNYKYPESSDRFSRGRKNSVDTTNSQTIKPSRDRHLKWEESSNDEIFKSENIKNYRGFSMESSNIVQNTESSTKKVNSSRKLKEIQTEVNKFVPTNDNSNQVRRKKVTFQNSPQNIDYSRNLGITNRNNINDPFQHSARLNDGSHNLQSRLKPAFEWREPYTMSDKFNSWDGVPMSSTSKIFPGFDNNGEHTTRWPYISPKDANNGANSSSRVMVSFNFDNKNWGVDYSLENGHFHDHSMSVRAAEKHAGDIPFSNEVNRPSVISGLESSLLVGDLANSQTISSSSERIKVKSNSISTFNSKKSKEPLRFNIPFDVQQLGTAQESSTIKTISAALIPSKKPIQKAQSPKTTLKPLEPVSAKSPNAVWDPYLSLNYFIRSTKSPSKIPHGNWNPYKGLSASPPKATPKYRPGSTTLRPIKMSGLGHAKNRVVSTEITPKKSDKNSSTTERVKTAGNGLNIFRNFFNMVTQLISNQRLKSNH